MSVYFCRWPNGDFSIVTGPNRLAIDEVLDEVGNPDRAKLTRMDHAVAIHFGLKDKIECPESMIECFKFEAFDELSTSDFFDAYPHLYEAFDDSGEEGATQERIEAAMRAERDRIKVAPEMSDDPKLAELQRAMGLSKRMTENYNRIASKLAAEEPK